MANEQKVQKLICTYLDGIGAYNFKVISATRKGILDINGCHEGKFFAIEVKLPEKKNNVSALQHYNITAIHKAGGVAFVAWSVEIVIQKFKELDIINS